ncbi:ring finger protein 17 [Pitangus sulphuratus]|nr:ring finger protein 17 [Pitangus sulphuratus]
MNRKKEFCLLDDSNKEPKRRKMKAVRPFSHNTEEKTVHCLVSSNDGLRDEPALTPSADMQIFPQENTGQDIEEALCIAVCNLGHFREAGKLWRVCSMLLLGEDDLGCEMRRKLFAELMENISNYSASIAKAKEVIEEKKKHLIRAIRTAKELKFSHFRRNRCDLAKVIYDLKLPVEAELSRVKSLKEKIFSSDEIISSLENLGKIKWGMTENKDNGRDTFILDDQEEMPDVIIEEILEDDLEGKFLHTRCFQCSTAKHDVIFVSCLTLCACSLTELVLVSHVINPSHFYIRRYSQRKEALALEKKLENFCCNKSSYLLPSDTLELGARIFIKSKETGMWCRGTVTELTPLESKEEVERKPCGPMRYKVCDVALLKVFLIDVGSSVLLTFSGYDPSERPDPAALQTVETDDICLFVRKSDQCIEAELAAIPPLAVRCSLKDVVPKNTGEGWGEEAKKKFLELVNNKIVSMIVFREEDGVLIVDLRKPPFSETSSNIPVSLKDALVFLDLARFRLQLPSQLENNTILHYSPPNIPKEGEEVFVVVCHINSPSDFYLCLRENLESFPEKIQELNKPDYGENSEIFCPVEGQACIAKQEDGNWYRAQIIGLPSCQEVTVKYVDYGNTANLPHKDIRRVKEEFLSFPVKAIRCRLACIEPFKGTNEWNREAKRRFEEITEDKVMLCSVIEILDNSILSVELFNSSADNGRKLSINCQLVEEDLASYIPGYTKSTAVGPNEVWDDPLEENPKSLEVFNPIDMEPVDEGLFRLVSNKDILGRISHVVSPSKIFVQLLSSESILKSLQEEMASIYKESQPQSVKWKSGMHCAVYVVLYDSGAEKTVEISCLRKLEENMKIIRKLAVECSLTDISSEVLCQLTYCYDLIESARTDTAGVACSKEHLKVHVEQENTQLGGYNSKTACGRSRAVPEEHITVSESEQKSFKTLPHSGMDETYKSPAVPEAKIFQAIVSCIGGDGTIYIIPKSSEIALSSLMAEIQNTFKGLGLLIPYCWKKGEACVVRGSDTMWYRGQVVEVCGSTLQVRYIDHGYIESIPQCHLYPTTFYTDTPPFCIPCQLYKTLPKLLDNPRDKLSISLYFGGISLSSFMAHQKYCITEGYQDIQKVGLLAGGTRVSRSYKLPPLPVPGNPFPVRVTHLVSPKEVYICFDASENCTKQPAIDIEGAFSSDSERLDEALKWCNKIVECLPLLTSFEKGLPCLAEYVDGLWYRAKLLSVIQLVPVQILVQFVDYGTYLVAPTNRLRHIPYCLLKYPAQAVRVLLAGFKPALDDTNTVSPEITVCLYGDDKNLVHMKLIEMGLADFDE